MSLIQMKQSEKNEIPKITVNKKNTGLVIHINGQALNIFRKDYHLWLQFTDAGFAGLKAAILEHLQS